MAPQASLISHPYPILNIASFDPSSFKLQVVVHHGSSGRTVRNMELPNYL